MFTVDLSVEKNQMTSDEVSLLQKNIAFWLNTPRGSLPQMRDFGLNYDVIDEPLQTFKMKITVDTISKVRELYGENKNNQCNCR